MWPCFVEEKCGDTAEYIFTSECCGHLFFLCDDCAKQISSSDYPQDEVWACDFCGEVVDSGKYLTYFDRVS